MTTPFYRRRHEIDFLALNFGEATQAQVVTQWFSQTVNHYEATATHFEGLTTHSTVLSSMRIYTSPNNNFGIALIWELLTQKQ